MSGNAGIVCCCICVGLVGLAFSAAGISELLVSQSDSYKETVCTSITVSGPHHSDKKSCCDYQVQTNSTGTIMWPLQVCSELTTFFEACVPPGQVLPCWTNSDSSGDVHEIRAQSNEEVYKLGGGMLLVGVAVAGLGFVIAAWNIYNLFFVSGHDGSEDDRGMMLDLSRGGYA